MPEIDVGLGGGASFLQRICRPGKMRRMMLTGERVPAAELHRLGAVEACLPRDEVLPAAVEIAAAIADKSPIAVQPIRGSFDTVGQLCRCGRLPRRAGLHDRAQQDGRRRRGAARLHREAQARVLNDRGSADEPRWKRRPEGSNWGDFGPDDQVGRLNLLDAGARARGRRARCGRA